MITIGYGDILPKTNIEIGFSLIAMMSSCFVYAYCFNEVGNIFRVLNKKKYEIKENMSIINK